MKSDNSIYLHIPFCKHRCAYCDFNTYAGQEELIPAYVDALIREINYIGQRSMELPDGPTKRTHGLLRRWDALASLWSSTDLHHGCAAHSLYVPP